MMERYGCEPGGMHRLDGGISCVCGATKSPVIMQRDAFEKMKAALAAAGARADGLALVVQEMRAALEAIGERFQAYDVVIRDSRRSQVTDMIMHQILGSDLVRAILASDPEARASELLAAAQEKKTSDD